jgi:hypothetical protein
VNLETAEVYRLDKQLKPTLVGTEGKNGTRYRHEIYYDGHKRTIVRAKLVYLAGSLQALIKGHVIHHLDEDRYNDVWGNLVSVSNVDHDKMHYTTEILGDTPF